jgi:hypothetical protein
MLNVFVPRLAGGSNRTGQIEAPTVASAGPLTPLGCLPFPHVESQAAGIAGIISGVPQLAPSRQIYAGSR